MTTSQAIEMFFFGVYSTIIISAIIIGLKNSSDKRVKTKNLPFKYDWEYATQCTKESCLKYAFGTFLDFEKLMLEINWKRDPRFLTSWFDHSNNSQVHAGHFVFNDIGMIFTHEEFVKVKNWMNDHSLEKTERLIVKEW